MQTRKATVSSVLLFNHLASKEQIYSHRTDGRTWNSKRILGWPLWLPTLVTVFKDTTGRTVVTGTKDNVILTLFQASCILLSNWQDSLTFQIEPILMNLLLSIKVTLLTYPRGLYEPRLIKILTYIFRRDRRIWCQRYTTRTQHKT